MTFVAIVLACFVQPALAESTTYIGSYSCVDTMASGYELDDTTGKLTPGNFKDMLFKWQMLVTAGATEETRRITFIQGGVINVCRVNGTVDVTLGAFDEVYCNDGLEGLQISFPELEYVNIPAFRWINLSGKRIDSKYLVIRVGSCTKLD